MKEEITEEVDIEDVKVPNDDLGDLISVLFKAGFSDEETDVVLEAVADMRAMPDGEVVLDEEMIKLSDKFEELGIELDEEGLAIIRGELLKRFS